MSSMNDATDKVRKDWDEQADGWYRQRESMLADSRPIHEWLVQHIEPVDGKQILEVAAGPGDTGFLLTPHLGNGRLVSTDIAESMVEAARKRGTELGIKNVEYRTLDAQAMELSDDSFDAVICRWGFMLMPDPAAAVRECKRVLKPGGRFTFAVFTGPDENPFASMTARILIEMGLLPPPSPEWRPGILALGDRNLLQKLFDDAKFSSVQIEPVDMTWTFRNADEYWVFLVDLTAFGPLLRSLPDNVKFKVHNKINEQLVQFTNSEGVILPSRCWCGLAIK